MASIKFRIHGKNTPSNIYVRLSLSRDKVFERKTGYTVNRKDWGSRGLPIDRDEVLKNLKASLNGLSNHIENRLNEALTKHIYVDSEWLKTQINSFHGIIPSTQRDEIINHIQFIIDNASRIKKPNNQIGLSKSRIKSYKRFKNTISRFQEETNKGKNYLIRDVDFSFGERFADWQFSKGFSINYVGKNIDDLKAVCRDANKRGIDSSEQLDLIKGFTKSKDSSEIVILNEQEQASIKELDIKRKGLVNARKWLLLGCQLGQRFSDLIRITQDDIRSMSSMKVIEITQKKTGKMVAIPLLPEAEEIIEEGMPYPISLQKFNEYAKEICKLALIDEPLKGSVYLESEEKSRYNTKTPGIYPKWQLIGSHVCRRSFASNFYNKIPTPILIGITGHGTEKMFLKYIGRTSYDNAHQMMEYFGKLEAKSKKEPVLHVIKKAQ